MKLVSSFLAIFHLLVVNVFSQQWATVGAPSFTNGQATNPFIAVNKNGIPYVVYVATSNYAKATVMKFDGNNWVTVGKPGFSIGSIDVPSMTFDKNGMPVVAYMDNAKSNRATVMRFNGANWVNVGSPGFTVGTASYPSIAFDSNGTLYIAFRDQGDTVYSSWPNGFRTSVMKFDGSNWVYVGSPGFSSNAAYGGAMNISLIIDKNDKLYVGFADYSNEFKACVMTFNGSNWVYVGAPWFSAWETATPSFALDSNGTPYMGYWDGAKAGKATVMKFDGNSWVPVGVPGFTQSVAEFTSLVLDKNGTPYLLFMDYANNQKATVMKFDGTNWVFVGSPGFSGGEAWRNHLALDSKGTLYAAYTETSNTNSATVMKFENAVTGMNETKNDFSFTIFPNPNKGTFLIIFSCLAGRDCILRIRDVHGQLVHSEIIAQGVGQFKKEINLGKKEKGIYFAEMIQGNERRTGKIILE